MISCARQEPGVLRVTSDMPAGVMARDGSIVLVFSRGVVPPESTNVWMTTPYVEFSPSVPGKFVWQDTCRLLFSPDGPLPGDATFKGTLNTGLLVASSKATGFAGPAEFSFSTERFRMTSAEFFYDRLGEKRQVGIKANLEFTYDVDPQHLQPLLKVTIDGVVQSGVHVAGSTRARVIPIEVGVAQQLEHKREIAVEIDPALVSPETNTHLVMDRAFTFTLPPLGELQIHGHDFGYDGQQGWIRVRTSQEVDAEAVKRSVRIEPVRPYAIQTDNAGFTLRGEFRPGEAFRLTVNSGLESVLGGKTRSDYEADVVIGNIQPSFRFASESGTYMLLGGKRQLEIRTTNLPRLAVRVSQVFQNNLVYFLDEGRYYDYSYEDYTEEQESQRPRRKFRYVVRNFGRQLDYDTLEIAGAQNREVSTWLNLEPYLNNGYKGFYVVELANPAEAWRTTGKLVVLSDIGLVVKRSDDELMVFATSLASTKPLSGVTVTLVSTNNQVIATGATDGDGVARFADTRTTAKDFPLKLVTAERDNDFNFIHLDDYRIETSRYDVSGKRDAGRTYDALVYGDRNIYRPGEKVRIAGVVRDLTRPLPASMPVRVKVTNPRGTLVNEQQLVLNEQGSFETAYQTQPTSLTGEYFVSLFTANDLFLTSYPVSIEEFVPDRLRVQVTASLPVARPGDRVRFDLQAHNFFGPPAAGRNWEFEGSYEHVPFQSKAFAEFRFSDDAAKNYTASPEVRTGVTDGEGKASVEFSLPGQLPAAGMMRFRGRVAVFDESGRPVYQVNRVTVHPKPYFIGLRNRGPYYVSPNVPQKVQVVAVDAGDRVIAGFVAKIELVRYEWHSVLRQHQNTGTLRYVSERREIPVRADRVTIGDAPAEYTYMAPRSGEYSVRVSRDGDTGYNEFSFYSYSWGTTDITSFEVDPEARVEMAFDKAVYAPGEKAKILFRTPFSGRMLVTVERNRVYSHQYVDVADNAASVTIPVEESYLPNVYVTAVLFRKITDQDIPLLAGHGFAPLLVEKASNKLEVSISAPERIRPKTRQVVTVRAGREKDVFLTLAAVDEGICQVKNYRTPDPYGYFYGKKALETTTHDFFRDLLPERRTDRSSAGGGEAEMSLRANPLGVQRFKPVSLWSGIVRTGTDGSVEVPLDVPEFNGELRLMVFAYKGDRFGAAQQAMKVSDPVVLTPALPRFLSPGDSLIMPITAFNTTGNAVSLRFDIVTTGGLVVTDAHPSLEVGPNQERFVEVGVRATKEIGAASVKVRTKAFGEAIESVTELPVRPTAPYAVEALTGVIQGGQSVAHEVTDAFLVAGRRSYITMSPFPVAGLAKELKGLLGYPHGCLEQTVSKAFPQIYLRDIAGVIAPMALAGGSPTYFVNEAIAKLLAMQLPDGSFMYWPGEAGSANPWATVYATHFLTEAKRAGYAVPEAALRSAQGAVAQIARSKQTEEYYSYQANRVGVRRIAGKAALYGLYVLAVGGIPDRNLMEYFRVEKSLLTYDTRFLLAGAYALSGDRRTFLELLPPQFVVEEPQRTSGWAFDSPVRANALMLNVLLETDLNNPLIPQYLEYLAKQYRADAWYSTQDNAFTLLAFGKAARVASAAKAEGTVVVGGKEYAYRGGTQKVDADLFGKKVAVSLRGEGRVYYSLVTEGIRTDGRIPIGDRNLQVRREFFDRSGNSVGQAGIRRNDLVVVKITVTSSVDRLDYVAVSDLLPAGLEIENPRVTDATHYAFIKNPTLPDFLDIRDDRIVFYTSFRGQGRQAIFYYAVRAVSQGTFVYAPVVAEAMYDGNYRSASGGGEVKVGK